MIAISLSSLDEVARIQHGMVTTAQAGRLGVTRQELSRLVAEGHILRVARGLYAVGRLVESDPERWHWQQAYGAGLLYPDAVFVSTTALIAYGIPVWGADLSKPYLVRAAGRPGGSRQIWVRRRPATPAVHTDLGPTVPLAQAIIGHCLDHGITPGVVAADAALNTKRVTPGDLENEAARVSLWPRSSRARACLTFMDSRHESVGESRCAVECAAAAIALTPQVVIRDARGGFIARVDFLVDGTKVVIEFDGKVKYFMAAGRGRTHRSEDEGDVLWREKLREDALRVLGYTVVRLTWADLEQGRVVAKVRAGIAVDAALRR